jgi:bacteriorhodopsin
LVTLIAAVHYFYMREYMREYWVCVHKSPIVYRYIDWSITVPLQMIEFNLILKAAKAPIGPQGFWRLLVGTVLMLAFGYAGETKAMNPTLGFALGMCGWAFILFEIFAGESANASGGSSAAVQQSFNNMRIIVSLGWAIYPAGYVLGTLTSGASSEALNVTYNIADFVNKIAFVLACWACAKTDSATSGSIVDIVSNLRSEFQSHSQAGVSAFGEKVLTSVGNQLSKLDTRQQEFEGRIQKQLDSISARQKTDSK